MANPKLKLLFVSKKDFSYNRDLILLNGLKARNDVELEMYQFKKNNWNIFSQIKKKSKEVDFVIVPSFRHKDVAFVKWASHAPVVFDPLISIYMTRVLDYQKKWKGPHKHLVDWLSFSWPDILIWDTKSHLNFIKKKYNLDKPMNAVFIGVDTNLFYPINRKENNKIVVGFYGSYNPLQGIDKIVKAAHLLRNEDNIAFKLIGFGSTFDSVQTLSKDLKISNIEFLPKVPYDQLNDAINEFDICLGVFGESMKTNVVIPNKIFHYAAAKKCIITKETAGIKEVFEDDHNISLVENTPKALSEKIRSLAKDVKKREKLAIEAYQLVTKNFNQHKIADSFVEFLRTCM